MARDDAHRALKNSLFMFVRMAVALLAGCAYFVGLDKKERAFVTDSLKKRL